VDAGQLQLNLQPVAVRELLERTAVSFQHQAQQQQINLTAATPTNLFIQADESRLIQLLGNLISNALRHTPPDGHIWLQAESDSNLARLIVQDDGEGIPPEDVPHIFDRFYRADKSRHTEQSGMGLAITRSLVEVHGGTIEVSSRVGEGTKYVVAITAVSV
ncbi:MAG: sensor histidine kinase, partial [Chloroflexi bacterium]|nr:sensor histidine kinase [Chloroflexota bacterium]